MFQTTPELLEKLRTNLVGVYNCDSDDNLNNGKWIDRSGKGNDATINRSLWC